MNPFFASLSAAFSRLLVLGALVAGSWHASGAGEGKPVFRAGAAAIDITPTNYPVIVNAMFTERTATNAHDPLHARCLVLDDGSNRVAIAVVDTCMMSRELIDQAKSIAHQMTGIANDRMLVSATHTHSAPSAMGCLGSRIDPDYARFLPGKIAEALKLAARNLAPARIGWAVARDDEHTYCRRWIYRPDKMLTDPFGERSVRANMHPGHENPDAIGPAGPVDPGLSVLAIQSPDGRPIALLANYSMHYYESPLLSADYFGLFAAKIAKLLGAESGNGPFVAMMSQGTSGDQMWMDYGKPRKSIGLEAYAQEIAEAAFTACQRIQYHDWVPLVMRETKLTLNFRLCDEKRLAWATNLVAATGDRLPRTLPEIYAREQLYLRERPMAELKLQALRIGDLGIAAIPNEVFAITGLKIKAQSPLQPTFNIELANGAEGYIPPPEQHPLGGYTTWAARTAGLEEQAEPRIVEELLRLLEQVSGAPRRLVIESHGPYARAVLDLKPRAYFRFSDFNGPAAFEAKGRQFGSGFESGVAFHLEGPPSSGFCRPDVINRAVHFAGGRFRSGVKCRGNRYSIEFWFWNGLPNDARGVTGVLFSLGRHADQLAIGGTNGSPGRLIFTTGTHPETQQFGNAEIRPGSWNHVVLVRKDRNVAVYLNGGRTPDLAGRTMPIDAGQAGEILFAGGHDNQANFEGKLDEIAIYEQALTPAQVAAHYAAAGK